MRRVWLHQETGNGSIGIVRVVSEQNGLLEADADLDRMMLMDRRIASWPKIESLAIPEKETCLWVMFLHRRSSLSDARAKKGQTSSRNKHLARRPGAFSSLTT